MRLAFHFREPHVDAFLARLSAAEYREWAQFAEQEPFGYPAAWERTGTVAAAAYNAAPFRGKDARSVDPGVFDPRRVPAPPPPPAAPDPAGERALALALARLYGADVYDTAGTLVVSHARG